MFFCEAINLDTRISSMHQNLLAHDLVSQKENIAPFFSSKDNTTIQSTLTLNNTNRVFGTELSNLVYSKSTDVLKSQYDITKNVQPSLQSTQEIYQIVKNPLLHSEQRGSESNASTTMETENDLSQMNIEQSTSFFKPRNLEDSFSENMSLFYLDIEPADLERLDNPQSVAVYAKEISDYMKETEEKYLARPNYLAKSQKDINEKMRAILIDWLIDVHLKFKLLPETLYLTVNLIDRYLEQVPVTRQKLQLVGVACMLIACKYEEIYSPEVKDFVYVTDKAYRREEVLEMEGKILSVLKFQLTTPSSFRFFERYAQLAKASEKAYHLGCYLLDLCLIEYKMMRYTPSMLACGALYIGMAMTGNRGWSDMLVRNSKYEERAVRNCASELAMLAAPLHEKIALTAARRKYLLPKYSEVARIDLTNFC